MTVVPFTPARFTPADLAAFDAVALPRFLEGRWAATGRRTGRDSDQLLVYGDDATRPLFTLERDRSGSYRLFLHGQDGPHKVGADGTIEGCLALWQRRAASALTH